MNTYVLLLPLHIYFSISEYRKNKWNISSGNFLLICFIEFFLKREREKGLGFIFLLHKTAIVCIRDYIMKEASFQGKYVNIKAASFGEDLINLNALEIVELGNLKDTKAISFFSLF